jgi:hypothetical protein
MFTTFLFFSAALNYATGNLICGSICFASAMLRVMVTSK